MSKENNTWSSFKIRKKLIDKGVNVRTSTIEKHQIWESIIIKAKYGYNYFNIESIVNKKDVLKNICKKIVLNICSLMWFFIGEKWET